MDLSRLVAGNQVSALLADFGAEVVKIEPPDGDPLRSWGSAGHPIQWSIYARNKKSVCMNLRDGRAKELLLRLVETADVFIENFRVGNLERMGLGPDVLHARNPGLVILRVTGFGQTGPYRERPGFGTLIEAMTGFAMKTGFPDKPPSLPNMALADMVAGTYGAFGTMVALQARGVDAEGRKTGGQVIDLSLMEPLHAILGGDAAVHARERQVAHAVRQPLDHGGAAQYLPHQGRRVARHQRLHAGDGTAHFPRHRAGRYVRRSALQHPRRPG